MTVTTKLPNVVGDGSGDDVAQRRSQSRLALRQPARHRHRRRQTYTLIASSSSFAYRRHMSLAASNDSGVWLRGCIAFCSQPSFNTFNHRCVWPYNNKISFYLKWSKIARFDATFRFAEPRNWAPRKRKVQCDTRMARAAYRDRRPFDSTAMSAMPNLRHIWTIVGLQFKYYYHRIDNANQLFRDDSV